MPRRPRQKFSPTVRIPAPLANTNMIFSRGRPRKVPVEVADLSRDRRVFGARRVGLGRAGEADLRTLLRTRLVARTRSGAGQVVMYFILRWSGHLPSKPRRHTVGVLCGRIWKGVCKACASDSPLPLSSRASGGAEGRGVAAGWQRQT